MFNLNTNKTIKEVAKAINRTAGKYRPKLNILKLVDYKIYATDTYKAFIVETDEKRDEEFYYNQDIIKANELSTLNWTTNIWMPDDMESFIPSEIEADTSLNIDHLMDILKTYKKAGAKDLTFKISKDNWPVLIEDYYETEYKEWIKKITSLLMPLRKK